MVLAFSLGGDLLEFRTLVALSKRSRGVQTQNEPKPRTGLPACCGCCRLPACLAYVLSVVVATLRLAVPLRLLVSDSPCQR